MKLLGNYPVLLMQDYGIGITLVDIRDPYEPKFLWKEPERKLKYWSKHTRCGWTTGEFRDDYLYIPRLDRLDIYKVGGPSKSPLFKE